MLGGATHLNPVGVVGDFGEVGAAGVARRNILNSIRAAHRVEGTGRAGAVGVARGWIPVGRQQVQSSPAFISRCGE